MAILISDEEFVHKWAEAKKKGASQTWVAKELDVTPQAINYRKRNLKKLGVKLPELSDTYQRRPVDIDKLNEILLKDNK